MTAADAEVVAATSAVPETTTELPRADLKLEPKAKVESKPEPKTKPELKVETTTKCKPELKAETTSKSKPEPKAESSNTECMASTPPTRRRASADAAGATPERKKRRLTRPRKLWASRAPRPARAPARRDSRRVEQSRIFGESEYSCYICGPM